MVLYIPADVRQPAMATPPTPYELTFEHRARYLFANIKAGSISMQSAFEVLQEIMSKCRELGSDRLMVRQDIPTSELPNAAIFVVCKLEATDRHLRLAFIDENITHDDMQVFDVAAGIMGLSAKPFASVSQAEQWLLK